MRSGLRSARRYSRGQARRRPLPKVRRRATSDNPYPWLPAFDYRLSARTASVADRTGKEGPGLTIRGTSDNPNISPAPFLPYGVYTTVNWMNTTTHINGTASAWTVPRCRRSTSPPRPAPATSSFRCYPRRARWPGTSIRRRLCARQRSTFRRPRCEVVRCNIVRYRMICRRTTMCP